MVPCSAIGDLFRVCGTKHRIYSAIGDLFRVCGTKQDLFH